MSAHVGLSVLYSIPRRTAKASMRSSSRGMHTGSDGTYLSKEWLSAIGRTDCATIVGDTLVLSEEWNDKAVIHIPQLDDLTSDVNILIESTLHRSTVDSQLPLWCHKRYLSLHDWSKR